MLVHNFSFCADEFGVQSFGKTVEERSQRFLSAIVVSYLIYLIDCALPGLKKCGTRQEIVFCFACQIPFSVET